MTRTPREIFEHHAGALIAGDIDEIVTDYTDDAVFITPAGVRHGKDGVREGFIALLADLPNAKWDVPTQIFAGDVLFIEWSAVSASRLNEAAQRALSLYPGPVGQLVHREIQAYLDFGHQFGQPSLITRLAEDLLATTTHQR